MSVSISMPVSISFDGWAVTFQNPWIFSLQQDGDKHTACASYIRSDGVLVQTPAHSHSNQANAVLAVLLSIIGFESSKQNDPIHRAREENSGEAKSGPASASCAMDCSAGAYLSPTIGLASVGENFEAERRALMREAETKYRQVCLATDVLPPT